MTAAAGLRTATLEFEGATIRYDWREGNGPALAFVPGWCCSRSDWYEIAAGLQGFATATIALPGQGESSSGGRTWSLSQFGSVVTAVVEKIGWTAVVPIGHSMGGAVAVEAARELADRAKRVICIDALTYDSFYARQDEPLIRSVLAQYGADFPAAMRTLVDDLFVDREQPALMNKIATTMGSVDLSDALSSMRALLEWDRDRALADCRVPIDVISAQAFLAPDVVEHISTYARVTPVDLGGHFFLRENPQQTAEVIAAVLNLAPDARR